MVKKAVVYRASEQQRARFARIVRENLMEAPSHDGGIGTLGEKRMHAVIKCYLADRFAHEVRLEELLPQALGATSAPHAAQPAPREGLPPPPEPGARRARRERFVADVFDGERIWEVQTGSFYPLRQKLTCYLERTQYPITLVHPIAAVKYLSWIDPKTGAIGAARRSPRHGRVQDIADQLYWLTPYIASGRVSLRILLCEVREYRWRNGWSRDGKRGSERYERIPTALLGDVTYATPEDYRADFLPDTLPDRFSAAEYAQQTDIRGMATYGALSFLTALGLLCEGERRGRAKTWERV